MKLNTTPDSIAEYGGVKGVSEFRIRNSAKAFGILSSGLYANKIRAIIRELSCNAYDSHVAAGKKEVPFDIHLPTTFAAYFAIRDYGTGLDHQEVIDIYTTYFESTKTESNDFVGALGLGSKSPFSYTENFTVTAFKDGKKNVYSAFINEAGVPSVAIMSESDTDEPNGVEVRFAVDNQRDFYQFQHEAVYVLQFFTTKPNMTGQSITIPSLEYYKKDLVPGVHQREESSSRHGERNRAIMGNIAYPIELPDEDDDFSNDFNGLKEIDRAGLDLEFEIGEVDFQASREGLSYDKRTVAAIKAKYQELADAMAGIIENEVKAFKNEWERAEFVVNRSNHNMWRLAIRSYLTDNPCPLVVASPYGYGFTFQPLEISKTWLADECNIALKILERDPSGWGSDVVVRDSTGTAMDAKGNYRLRHDATFFMPNPEMKRIVSRTKYHLRNTDDKRFDHSRTTHLVMMTPVVGEKEMNLKKFYKALYNPPATFKMKVDDLLEIPTINSPNYTSRKISAVSLAYDRYGSDLTWSQMEEFSPADMDDNETYYYFQLVGYKAYDANGKEFDGKQLFRLARDAGMSKAKIYGIRKHDHDTVENAKNWKRFEEYVREEFDKVNSDSFITNSTPGRSYYSRDEEVCVEDVQGLDPKSPYRKFVDRVTAARTCDIHGYKALAAFFGVTVNAEDMRTEAAKYVSEITERYPLIKYISSRKDKFREALAGYVKLVDKELGV